jgi:S-(hydroxymethyl)glutathione dehydrogenase/alcohol dehydrogenase
LKAAVLHEANRPLRIHAEVEAPPPAAGQVLVRLAYSGVCHSQLMEARGRRGPDRHLPHLLGHEGSGVVAETGAGVSKVRPGDRVILGWIRGAGAEVPSSRYRCGEELFNAGAITTFNESAVVSENRCFPLPQGVPMDVAVLFGCALPTGAGIVFNELRPPAGSTLAIFGLGGIGLSALIASGLFQCQSVIAVDVSEEKLALAREFGATHTVNAASTDPVAAVRELSGGKGVDFAIEASGLARVIETAFNSVRRAGGLCVFASHPAYGEQIHLDPYELISGKQIRGSWGGAADPDADIPRMAELYRQGKLPLEKLITRRYPLDRINEALEDLERMRVGRPLIEINPALGRAA